MPNMQNYVQYQAEQPSDFVVLPSGNYTLKITNIADKTTNNGTPYTNLTLKVLDGQFANRCTFIKLWWTTKSIGFSKWSVMKLLQIFGQDPRNVDVLTDIDTWNKCLLNRHFKGDIKLIKSADFGDSNDLSFVSLKPVDGTNTQQVQQTQQVQMQPQTQYKQPPFNPQQYQQAPNAIPQQTTPLKEDELPF